MHSTNGGLSGERDRDARERQGSSHNTFYGTFEQRVDNMTNPVLRVFPVRYMVATTIFFGFMINYILRNSISLAIVAMVNHTAVNSSAHTDNQPDGPFVWDENVVGLILGSFYYGYICTQVVGGRFAELYSVKYIHGVSLLTAGFLTFLIPTAAYWDYRALVTLRITMGFTLGVGFPSGYALLRSWTPPNERSTMSALTFSATNVGTAIAMPLASLIINSINWESVFYIQGSFALVWFIFWILIVYNSPNQHPFITTQERDFIETAIGTSGSQRSLPLPWKEVMLSPPVWALSCANFCNNWGFYTLINDLPQYFSNVLGKDISSSAIFTSLPFLCTFIFAMAYSKFSDYLRERNVMGVTNIRRLAMFVSHALIGITLVIIAFVGKNQVAVEVLLFFGIALFGAGYSGWQSVPMDMAPNYAGTLIGISNTWGSIPGFLAPQVVGLLTVDNETLERWRWCFLIPAALLIFNFVVFMAFGSSEEQAWNRKFYTAGSESGDAGEAGRQPGDGSQEKEAPGGEAGREPGDGGQEKEAPGGEAGREPGDGGQEKEAPGRKSANDRSRCPDKTTTSSRVVPQVDGGVVNEGFDSREE